MMVTIDNLKRLCVDHYFEEEIESAMQRSLVNDRKFSAGNSVFLSHQTSQQ